MSDLASLLPILWGGFLTTLAIFGLTLLFSLPLGLLVAVLKMSRFRAIRYPVSFYISLMRGTPLLLQIVAIYFGSYYLSEYSGMQLSFDRFPAVIAAFSINYAAYFAEIFRGGIQSISRGQYEAAAMLGLSRRQTFFRIILPQVIKRIVPASANEVITLVKDTSLARIIALQEIIWAGQSFLKGSQGIAGAIWPMFFTAFYYLIFTAVITWLLNRLEKKLSYFH